MSNTLEQFVWASDTYDALHELRESHNYTSVAALIADQCRNRTGTHTKGYRITIEEIDVPEQPRWWGWYFNPDTGYNSWERRIDGPAGIEQVGNGVWAITVWGTTDDRNAKRDAIRDAIKKGGKPE